VDDRLRLARLRGWYDARALTAAEWTPAILFTLQDGPLRYRDILLAIRDTNLAGPWTVRHKTLHESVLARSLRRLVDEGMLIRLEKPGAFPPSVHYELSESSRELLDVLQSIASWSERHHGLILRAQRVRRSSDETVGE
jgi:DNA-binding HxlR family transcriptional regulator